MIVITGFLLSSAQFEAERWQQNVDNVHRYHRNPAGKCRQMPDFSCTFAYSGFLFGYLSRPEPGSLELQVQESAHLQRIVHHQDSPPWTSGRKRAENYGFTWLRNTISAYVS
jgi:hypothetical protein